MNGYERASAYHLLSLLLQYPDDSIVTARIEVAEAVRALPNCFERRALAQFVNYFLAAEPTHLRQRYVETFDLGRRCSLHLSHFVYGDTRRRGTSLLRLKRLYAAAGQVLDSRELPDYLPLVLEFAALAAPGRGEQILTELRVPLELLRRSLVALGSPYAVLVEAICHRLPRLNPLQSSDLSRLAAEGPPSEQVGLEPFAPPEVMPVPAHP